MVDVLAFHKREEEEVPSNDSYVETAEILESD